MKRFEYQWIFIHKDYYHSSLKHLEPPKKEIAATAWLDSFDEAKKRFPSRMCATYHYIRFNRTGRKFRGLFLWLKIQTYYIFRQLR